SGERSNRRWRGDFLDVDCARRQSNRAGSELTTTAAGRTSLSSAERRPLNPVQRGSIMFRTSAFITAFAALTALAGCGQATPEYYTIRPGFACKVLTPNGYERDWRETGMMNLGGEGIGGIRNQAVCLETTTYQVEEQFAQDDPRDHQDHRVLTRSGQRVAYDFYVRLIVPNDQRIWDSVLAQITATQSQDQSEGGRVNYITVADIFERYGNQEARSYGRQVATAYDSDLDMNNNRAAIETALTRSLSQRLGELHAPL